MRAVHGLLQVEVSRSDDVRALVLGALFTRQLKGIGPDGAEAVCNVSRGGKMNKSGRNTYCGHIPHLNPLLDVDTAVMMQLLFRWFRKGEPSPDFVSNRCRDLFATYLVCPAQSDGGKPMRYDDQLRHTKSIFDHIDLRSTHFLHQWKGEVLRAAESGGMSDEDMDRMTRVQQKVRNQSYVVGLSTIGSVFSAGGEMHDVKSFYDPQLIKLPDAEWLEAIDLLLPFLRAQRGAVAAAVKGKTGKELDKARLFSAQGCLRALERIPV